MAKIKKLKLNSKSFIAILAVSILIMVALYYYFFLEVRVMGEKISAISNENDSLKNKETNLDSLREIFSNTTNEREKINSYFVQSDGAVDFITTIESLASTARLSYQTESVNTTEETPPSSSRERLNITLRTDGSWQNTFYFISLLESLPFNISIHQINLHATGNTSKEEIPAGPSPIFSSSSSSTALKVTKGSIWQGTYSLSVVKLK